jgi:hypothetical protein
MVVTVLLVAQSAGAHQVLCPAELGLSQIKHHHAQQRALS